MTNSRMEYLVKSQAEHMVKQAKINRDQKTRIDGLLKRWDDAHADGLSIYYRKKVHKLLKYIKHLHQTQSPRGYGVGQ